MIKNIQILIAFASIIVIFYYMLGMVKSYTQQAQYYSFFWSWSVHCIAIFFIISGFIMCYNQNLKNNFLFFLDSASCSIYLVHVFTLHVFNKIFSKLLDSFSCDFFVILCVNFTALLGALFYILVEKPVIFSFKKRLN